MSPFLLSRLSLSTFCICVSMSVLEAADIASNSEARRRLNADVILEREYVPFWNVPSAVEIAGSLKPFRQKRMLLSAKRSGGRRDKKKLLVIFDILLTSSVFHVNLTLVDQLLQLGIHLWA